MFWLFSRLPLSALQALGGWLGASATKMSGYYYNRFIVNFHRAYPDITPTILKEAGRSTGRMVSKMPYFWMRKDRADVASHLFDVCRTAAERVLTDGCGPILLTPHLGCFEVLPQAYAHKHPVTSLSRPPHKVSLRDQIETIRAGPNIQMAPADPCGVHMLVHILKHDEAVGILPDQISAIDEGVWAPFPGKPTYAMTLVYHSHRFVGVSVVTLFAERLLRGAGYHLYLEEIGDLPEDVMQAAARISAAVKRLVAVAPMQYPWGYSRYKHPKDADTSPAA